MTSFKRRLASAALATAMATSFGMEAAWAQGATVGPAGGIPSSTAQSNSAGTPAGGTGVVGGTAATPGMPTTGTQSAAPGTAGSTAGTTTTKPSRRATRRANRHARRAPAAPAADTQ